MEELLMAHLDECMAAIEAGESAESCLARYPNEADELAALLQIALTLESMPQPGPSAITSRTARSQFLNEARRRRRLTERNAARSRLRNWWGRLAGRFSVPTWLAPMRALATAALSLALLLLIGGGVIYAADGSLPGDPLYGFKLLGEDVRRALTFKDDTRARLEEALTARRRAEVGDLLTLGRQEEVTFGGVLQERSDGYWLVGDIPVIVNDETHIQSEPPLRALVEIQGATLTDGTVLAELVHIEGAEIVGRVEAMGQNEWQVAGLPIQVGPKTHTGPEIQVGDCVEVHARRLPDGTQVALEIERSEDCQSAPREEDDAAQDPTPEPLANPTWTPAPSHTPTPTVTVTPSTTPASERGGDDREPTATLRPLPASTLLPVEPSPPLTSEPEEDSGDEEHGGEDGGGEDGNEEGGNVDGSSENPDDDGNVDDSGEAPDDDESDGDSAGGGEEPGNDDVDGDDTASDDDAEGSGEGDNQEDSGSDGSGDEGGGASNDSDDGSDGGDSGGDDDIDETDEVDEGG